MELYKILDRIMSDRDLKIADVARLCGLPDSTVRGIITRKQKSTALDVAFKLAEGLNVSLEYLNGSPEHVMAKPEPGSPELSWAARKIAEQYDRLDERGRGTVKAVADYEETRLYEWTGGAAESEARAETKVIPLLGSSFAAGYGEPDFGNMWEDYEVPADSRADFAIKINGDSMEPYLPDGSIALGRKQTPRDGDVAALLINGEFLVKQVCQDSFGNVYLFSLNRSRSDADRKIMAKDDQVISCFGTVIMERAVPLPSV